MLTQPITQTTLDSLDLYDKTKGLIEDSGYYEALRARCAEVASSESTFVTPNSAICLGLKHVAALPTHIEDSKVGMGQLIALEAILEAFAIPSSKVTIYDPAFNANDEEFLRFAGYNVPDYDAEDSFGTEKEPRLPVLDETTLVWSPGCPHTELYKSNWSVRGLNRIVWFDGHPALTALGRVVGRSAEDGQVIVDARVADDHEPERRASMLAEKRAIPGLYRFLRPGEYASSDNKDGDIDKDGKATPYWQAPNLSANYHDEKDGFNLDAIAQTLCWIPLTRLEAMGVSFWTLNPMTVKVTAKEYKD